MEKKKQQITRSGLRDLEEELRRHENEDREEINQAIKEAKAQGDLSENAEYEAAREAQRKNEERIAELTEILHNIEVVDDEDFGVDEVSLGKKVVVSYTKDGSKTKEKRTFYIVGTQEADSRNGKISNESPVGSALLKKKKGDSVVVELPNGKSIKYKIVSIESEE
ncbi:MAG: transcription elongation factor GreA [Lachnospiraceae bacterium]|nr:transcription elongation factor GreA [Lachnospiraceae bacterium]